MWLKKGVGLILKISLVLWFWIFVVYLWECNFIIWIFINDGVIGIFVIVIGDVGGVIGIDGYYIVVIMVVMFGDYVYC